MKTNLIQIKNRSGKLKINDDIWKESVDQFLEDVDKLYGAKAVAESMVIGEVVAVSDEALEEVHLEINSPGGSVLEGERVYQALLGMRNRGVKLVVTVNGQAASMGSVIAMAADEVRMTEGSLFLVHDARVGTYGTADEHEKARGLLESISDRFAGIYAARTGASKEDMRALMKEDRYMDAKEAKERGFVDVILNGDEEASAGRFDIRGTDPKITDMGLFEGKKEFEARISELEAELEQALTWESKAKNFEAELAQERTAAAELKGEFDALSAKYEDLEDDLKPENIASFIGDCIEDGEGEEPNADLEPVRQTVAALVTAQVAAAGHPAIKTEPTTDEPEGHLATFEKLNGAAATAYYKKHKAAIKAELRAQNH